MVVLIQKISNDELDLIRVYIVQALLQLTKNIVLFNDLES